MAKNVSKPSQPESTVLQQDAVYSGSFIGDLTGNADTATKLKEAFHLHIIGDAKGTFTTSGDSATADVKVLRADRADTAKHAEMADNVNHALTADSAAQASTALHALESDTATKATNADFAAQAGKATVAGSAVTASTADEATHALDADHALESEHAKKADVATTALKLANTPDNPVPEATHAVQTDEALHATRADYDCLGRLIHSTYLTKEEGVSKDEAFDQNVADSLYARKDQIILQATVSGKAHGFGTVTNQTLNLLITDLVADGDSSSLYEDIIFLDKAELPDNPNTTKAYLTKDKVLYLYDVNKNAWYDVRSKLTKENQDTLNQALEKIKNYVDLTSDQDIHGGKAFWDPVFAPIPSFEDAPDHAVVVLHNLRDIYAKLKCMINTGDSAIKELLDKLEERIDALEKVVYGISNLGDIYFAYKDLTITENTRDMIEGAVYVGYLEEDGTFIPLNPNDFTQVNPDQVPFYERHFIKDSNGIVTWKDKPFVHKQTNVSYVLLDHMPTAQEAEKFEADTWYYYPAADAVGDEQVGGGGSINGEFDTIQYLETEDIKTGAPAAGELNFYDAGDVLSDIELPPVPPLQPTLEGEFKSISFKENETIESASPNNGELNFYTVGDVIKDNQHLLVTANNGGLYGD